MPFIGKQPTAGFSTIVKDDLTPDGSTTAFTLSKQVASANDIAVFVGNVRQEPTDAYTVNGTTLTMTAAPASGVNFYVLHIAGTVESSVVPADDTISTAKIQADAITSAKLATGSVDTDELAANAVTVAKLASTLDLSSNTLTMPSAFNGIKLIQTVDPTGSNSFSLDLSSYNQVLIVFNNIQPTSQGANLNIQASTDGTTWVSNFNWSYKTSYVNTTTWYGASSAAANTAGRVIDNAWSGSPAGSNGFMLLGGIGNSNTSNKRITYSGIIGKQSPSNQEAELIFGQTQNDSSKYGHVKFAWTSGNFDGSSRVSVFNINHYGI